MHISELDQYRKKKDHYMRHGYDYKVESSEDKQRRGFAEHDGNYDNNALSIRVKHAESADNMPRIDSIEDPEKQDKSRMT